MSAATDHRILVIDDDPAILDAASRMLTSFGFTNVDLIGDSRNVLPTLERETVSAILLDLSMPHIGGDELLAQITSLHPHIPVIIVTAASDMKTIVSSIKSGAHDYITKPIDASRLLSSLQTALKDYYMQQEISGLRAQDTEDFTDDPAFAEYITACPAVRRLFGYIKQVAPSPLPVLVTGETGVGKELFAKIIYNRSGRAGEFVPVNAAGLDDTVFSDSLFGHVKGAFTGAEAPRDGLIKTAEGGILFLDEIGDLEEPSQVKLLRLLQDGTYYPLGSDKPRRTSTKIVAATNRNLAAMVEKGTFRRDLYYRLCFHRVDIPPLRERREDVLPLAQHFLEKAAPHYRASVPSLSTEALGMLRSYRFPGNARELEVLMTDALAESAQNGSEQITPQIMRQVMERHGAPFTPQLQDTPASGPLAISGEFPTLQEATDFVINEALRRADSNIQLAASYLGISRQALHKRLARKKIDD